MKYIFVFIIIFPTLLFGQGSIKGIVYDSKTNTPLVSANIYIQDLNIGTITDNNGNFVFENVAIGKHSISISFMGYTSVIKELELKKEQNINLKIKLEYTFILGKEVQISAKKEENIKEQSNRVNMITASQIEAAPIQSINEILDYVPGVNMNSTLGFFSGKTIVSMRGLPSNDQSRTLVVLDGVTLNKSDEGSVNWNILNKSNIEKIKIIKGPGPAMYGNGAMGGVIELTSKKPEKRLQGNALISYGTYNTINSNIVLSGIVNSKNLEHNLYWGINGSGRLSDGYISVPKQFRIDADTTLSAVFVKELNTSAKIGYSYKKSHQAEIQFNYFNDIRGSGTKVFEKYGANTEHDTYYGMGKYSGFYGNFKLNLNLYYILEKYNRMYEYMNEGEYKLYIADSKREDEGMNLHLSYIGFKHHEILGGFNFRNGSVFGTDTYYTSTDIITNAGKMDTYSFFLQDEMNFFNEKLKINIGLRYDFASFHDGLFKIDYPSYSIAFYSNFNDSSMSNKSWKALCPRFSMQYKFSDKFRIYISAAKGFRAPILDDMCRTGKRKGTFSLANPALNPELLTTYECGADAEFIKNLNVSVSVYYSIGKNFMYYVSTGDSINMGYKVAPIIQKRNIGKVEIYGSEIEAKYYYKNLFSIFVNYTYTHSQIKEYQINNPLVDINITNKYLTDIPSHKISAGFTWNNKIINTSFLYKYIGTMWINDQNIVEAEYLKTDKYDAYNIFSISFERKIIKGLRASIGIENIFNKIFITSDTQQCPGRFLTGTLKYSF